VQLLLGADDEVAVRKHAGECRGERGRGYHEAGSP
jgi:hypothetical protein